MRVVVAGLLVLTAVGSGSAVYYLPQLEPERQLSEITRILAPGQVETARRPVEDAGQGRTFASQTPLFARVPTETAGAEPRPAAGKELAGGAIGRAPQGPGKPATGALSGEAWRDTVASGGDDKRRALVVELQRELKRVGCYSGELNGEWNAAVQRSLRQFTDRENARLPLDEPDYIQLTLVKGHNGEGCSKCPKGQGLAEDGRCLPRGVIARVVEPGALPSAPRGRDEIVAGPAEKAKAAPPVQIVAIPEPKVAVVPADRAKKAVEPARTALASSWTTEVLPMTREVAVAEPAVPGALPLPGRMTLGNGNGRRPVETGSVADPRRAGDPALLVPPKRIERKTAALPGPVVEEPVAVPAVKPPAPAAEEAAPAEAVRPKVAPKARYDVQPAPVKVYRPAPSYAYAPPPVRSAPSRDWKSRVHNNELSSR